jgi:hypothetical protein
MIRELVNHLWQSTLFAIVAGLLALALRRNRAQVRYEPGEPVTLGADRREDGGAGGRDRDRANRAAIF